YATRGRAYPSSQLWMSPDARNPVMGGEQAVNVLATVRKYSLAARGKTMTAEEEAAFKQPILDKYAYENSAYYSTARMWDDGTIDPVDTRKVLGLGIAASLNAPYPDNAFGVFRM